MEILEEVRGSGRGKREKERGGKKGEKKERSKIKIETERGKENWRKRKGDGTRGGWVDRGNEKGETKREEKKRAQKWWKGIPSKQN